MINSKLLRTILLLALSFPLFANARLIETMYCSSASGQHFAQVYHNKAQFKLSSQKLLSQINLKLEGLDFEISDDSDLKESEKFPYSLISVEPQILIEQTQERCNKRNHKVFSQKVQLIDMFKQPVNAPFFLICEATSKTINIENLTIGCDMVDENH